MERDGRSGRREDHAETRSDTGQGVEAMSAEAPGTDTQPADHEEMMRLQRERMLWTYFANLSLGLWLLFAPFTFGYDDDVLVRE